MYKVFIVEDEHLIRDNLRHQIISLAENTPLFIVMKRQMASWHLHRFLTFVQISF